MPVTEEDRKHLHHHHNQDDCMIHVHTYLTEADVADDHQHIITGVSGPAKQKNRSHVHCIHGRTSFISEDCEGHWHAFDIITGPAVELCDDTHVHYFAGDTSICDDHCHTFSGCTGLGPSLAEEECDEEDVEECVEDIEEAVEECEEKACHKPYYKHHMPKYKYGKRPGEKE
ncbi:MAG TPA: YmaF family protein [Methylomusa anaerophila]|uniref:YmaF family protein n=1 Tax=Methylomusa anaerophila TaxID=1930071 RepID=A0A348AG35_9FIRM|nr:YmaF family protein [Methylomusa anaerophila]BBB90033.1 YmaF family protein [Methylomusa anaerophila]HML88239.1 YmaF family protein [Methylomusa anaerophila]